MNHWYPIALTGVVASLLLFSEPLAGNQATADEAQWIWGSENATESVIDGLCLFQKEFEIESLPTKAVFRITCDDQYVVRINNRLVGVNESWQDVERYDVTSLLKTGTNTIFVRARNLSEGPAGLLASLELSTPNGSKSIVSDSTWNASIQKSGTWNPDIAKIKQWKKAISFGTEANTTPWKGALQETSPIKVIGKSKRMTGKLELEDGDRVLFLGNTVIEREQRYGYWEAALTAHYPDKHIIFRNLGWSGDTVLGEARARFGSQQDGFDHLEVHVHAVSPTVIICGYGSNAAFGGEAELDKFIHDYENLLDALEATGAAIALMAPLKHEPVNGKFLSPNFNSNRDLYAAAIKQLGERRDCLYFELPQKSDESLTDNGVHLTEEGYAKTAVRFVNSLGIPAAETVADQALVETIRAKNELYFHRWRPQNETYLLLFRKHEQGNNAVEIPMFDPLVENLETKIAELRKLKPVQQKQEITQ